jgi:hypothetical protein
MILYRLQARLLFQVWFQNRRAKCRKHESQHYKSMSPQTFSNNNNNNNNNNNSSSRKVSSTTIGEPLSSKIELSDLKMKPIVVGETSSLTKSMNSMEKTFKLEQPMQSQSLMQSMSMSKGRQPPDYMRLEPNPHLFNPLQVRLFYLNC